MSKLSRKEFKELLTEWNNTFVNEKFNPNFKQKLKNIMNKNNLKNEIPEFDIVHVNAQLSDEFDEEMKEFRDPSSDIYKKINNFKQPGGGDNRDITYENTDYCRNEILKYLFNKKTITEEDIKRVNSLGKNKDIMIIFEVGDFQKMQGNLIKNKYDNTVWNLHDTFHVLFDFNQKSRTNFLKDFMNTWEFEEFLNEKLDFEDVEKLITYVNKKLSMNDSEKYTQHNADFEDFFASFMAFIYLYVFNNSIESLSLSDGLFSDTETVKEIIQYCSKELEKYINNVNLDSTKYIYINCP